MVGGGGGRRRPRRGWITVDELGMIGVGDVTWLDQIKLIVVTSDGGVADFVR